MRKFFSNLWSMTPTGFLPFLPLSAVYPPASCAVKNSTLRFRTGPRQRGSLGAFTSLAFADALAVIPIPLQAEPRSWLGTSHPRFRRLGSFCSDCCRVVELLRQQVPVVRRFQSLPDVHKIGVRSDQHARRSPLDAAQDLRRGHVRIGSRQSFEPRHALFLDSLRRPFARLCMRRNRGASEPGMHARDTHTAPEQFMTQRFCEPSHRELARAIRTLPRRAEKSEQARHVHNVGALLFFEQWQKIRHSIHHAPEINVHQPPEIRERILFKLTEQGHARVVE